MLYSIFYCFYYSAVFMNTVCNLRRTFTITRIQENKKILLHKHCMSSVVVHFPGMDKSIRRKGKEHNLIQVWRICPYFSINLNQSTIIIDSMLIKPRRQFFTWQTTVT